MEGKNKDFFTRAKMLHNEAKHNTRWTQTQMAKHYKTGELWLFCLLIKIWSKPSVLLILVWEICTNKSVKIQFITI